MSVSDITSLVSIITAAASQIESFYKDQSPKPVPTLDDTDPHPLDVGSCPLEVKHSVQMLEGACAQLCTTLAQIIRYSMYVIICMRIFLIRRSCSDI